jgi:hypothetical protein
MRAAEGTYYVFHLISSLIGSCPGECVNCPPSPRGTGDSSKGMRSAREGSHSFESIPAPLDLGSREAGVQRRSCYRPLLESGRTHVGRSQGVTDPFRIRLGFGRSSSKKLRYSTVQRMLPGKAYFTARIEAAFALQRLDDACSSERAG